MKKEIENIKQFVVDRFKPQGIEIDLDYGSGNGEMWMYLTPRDAKHRKNMDWGRTLIILRENFNNSIFWNVSEFVYPDNEVSERIVFKLKNN